MLFPDFSGRRRPDRQPRRVPPLAVFLLAIAGLGAGCGDFQKPRYDVSDRRLYAVPFRELDVRNADHYYWSENGMKVVAYFKSWVEQNWASYIVDESVAPDLPNKIYKWTGEMTAADWGKLTVGAPFDVILVGEIVKMSYKQPLDVNLLRGKASIRYAIYEAGTGRRLYSSGLREVTYPKQQEIDIPISALEFDQLKPRILEHLLQELGERIGKDLYGYYRD